MSGPLSGLTIVELAGIGPAPYACMLLSDMGSRVVRVERIGRQLHAYDTDENRRKDVMSRGRHSIAIDLKDSEGLGIVMRLIEESDVLIEGFRPGVIERMGLGPDVCLRRNPKLVIGRVTGWGQTGPLSHSAGHDINYISLAGVLEGIGRPGEGPTVPLAYLGDWAGGGMFLVYGVLSGIFEAQRSGKGQVIDSSMVEGAAMLNATNYALHAWGESVTRGEHILSGAAPHYDVYECSDNKWISIGPNEPHFFEELKAKLMLDGELWRNQYDVSLWPQRKERLSAIFKEKPRQHWVSLLEGSDVCFAPVLDLMEAAQHPHNVSRASLEIKFGVLQPMPTPKFSRTPGSIELAPAVRGEHTKEVLRDLGYSDRKVKSMLDANIVESRSFE